MSILGRIAHRLVATELMKDLKVKPNFNIHESLLKPKKFVPLGGGYFFQALGTRDDDRLIIYNWKVVGEYSNSFEGFDEMIVNPHSKMLPAHRGKGVMRRLYQHVLDEGYCFISGKRHSVSANLVWRSLSKVNPWFLVDRKNLNHLVFLGQDVPPKVAQRKDTRIVLLGKGWTVEKFMKEVT